MENQSPYERLDLPVNAPLSVVKRQYKKLIRQFSPEQFPDEFNDIRLAYDKINTQLFNSKAIFPHYKKALGGETQTEEAPSVFSLEIVREVFETPFNTQFELEQLLADIDLDL